MSLLSSPLHSFLALRLLSPPVLDCKTILKSNDLLLVKENSTDLIPVLTSMKPVSMNRGRSYQDELNTSRSVHSTSVHAGICIGVGAVEKQYHLRTFVLETAVHVYAIR